MSRPKSPVNQYWTDVHEQLVCDYINAQSKEERSRIYGKLQPTIRHMSEIILKRYVLPKYSIMNNAEQIEEYITDNEIYLIEYSLSLFDPTKGKAYSFIGTCIKRIYFNYVFRTNKVNELYDPLYNDENELIHDIQSDDDNKQSSDELLALGKKKIQSILDEVEKEFQVKNKNGNYLMSVNKQKKIVFNLILDILNERTEISRHSLTYYLMKKTGLRCKTLYKYLKDHGCEKMMVSFFKLNTDYMDNLYALSDHNKYPTIMDFLYQYKDETPEYKINSNSVDKKIKMDEKRKKRLKERNEIKTIQVK